jgi:1,4-alpha-glucan branching enzyme
MPDTHLTEDDLFYFNEGTHNSLASCLGAHLTGEGEDAGAHFAVWAPNASRVSVLGSFNGWDPGAHRLRARGSSGIWEGHIAGVRRGSMYKYRVEGRNGHVADKADPCGVMHQVPPETASVVWSLDYEWGDDAWMKQRAARNASDAPISIYEVHPGSWMRVRNEGNRSLTYREMAERLTAYVQRTGFTHVELMPLMEHPFFGSWGYQVTGYFAPSSRFGTPQDLKYLIDTLHQAGIGVILDWVPSHFPTDGHGLAFFDGTHLYEHADPRLGFHPDWNSCIFNYGRKEVRSFLLSSAIFWLREYHADGLRVDGVASMLYRDYSRAAGEWIPNQFGGRENIDAIDFLRQLNTEVYRILPDVQTIAEESTSWPMVSRPTYVGGLGFGMKWDMGWMHDTLDYAGRDPVHRAYHHHQLTFRQLYAFSENFVLPLSHDEVVHGKGSLIGRMPGDEWQKFANLRALFGYMFGQSGKKLLFMGGEIGQVREWNHDDELDWFLLDRPLHAGLQRWITDLNALYRSSAAVHATDFDAHGFEWVDADDSRNSVLSWLRGRPGEQRLLMVVNFTPIVREGYRIGVPQAGTWTERLNSDSAIYGGSGVGNLGSVESTPHPWHGRPDSITVTLPPLGALIFEGPVPTAARTGTPAAERAPAPAPRTTHDARPTSEPAATTDQPATAAPPRKSPPKKTAPKKTAAKKTTPKKTVKKPAKKTATRKIAANKSATRKKSPTKKAPKEPTPISTGAQPPAPKPDDS